MGTRKKVSVVIPVYNTEKYLRECLDSVLRQSLREFEVVCVNDGSTDSSRRILEEYARSDHRVSIIDQANRGPSAARNAGLAAARGEYIYFLDSDDFIDCQALGRLYDQALEGRLDILFFSGSTFFEDENLENGFKVKKNKYLRDLHDFEIMPGRRLYVCMVSTGSYTPAVSLQFFKREFLVDSRLTFFEDILHEDILFSFLVILRAERVKYIPDVLFHRRVRSGSIMTKPLGAENLFGYFISYLEMLRFAQNRTWDSEVEAALIKHLRKIHRQVLRIWGLVSSQEQEIFYSRLNAHEKYLFEAVFRSSLLRSILMSEQMESINSVKNSASYRIGRWMTWLPRQAVKLMRVRKTVKKR